jgi:hypothetical protein
VHLESQIKSFALHAPDKKVDTPDVSRLATQRSPRDDDNAINRPGSPFEQLGV